MSSEGLDFEDPAEGILSPKSSKTQQLSQKGELLNEQSKEGVAVS